MVRKEIRSRYADTPDLMKQMLAGKPEGLPTKGMRHMGREMRAMQGAARINSFGDALGDLANTGGKWGKNAATGLSWLGAGDMMGKSARRAAVAGMRGGAAMGAAGVGMMALDFLNPFGFGSISD